VLDTRDMYSDVVNKRRRACLSCGHKFNTYELGDALWGTIRKYIPAHQHAVEKVRIRTQRNAQIKERLLTGEKHLTIAIDFNLSPNMVSTIARQMGVPSKRKLSAANGGPSIALTPKSSTKSTEKRS
jgi:hypothetical protein